MNARPCQTNGKRLLKQHRVRTFKSAEPLARGDQLAWKIAEVAADPVAVERDVIEMIGIASSTMPRSRPPRSGGARSQARGHRQLRIRLRRARPYSACN